jgi:hypothetical protein
MRSQDSAYTAGYALGQLFVPMGLLAVALVLLGVGIIVAVRAKHVALRGCAVVGILAGLSAIGLAISIFVGGIVAHVGPGLASSENYRVVSAKDNSCEISVPSSWVENPKIKEDATIVANDPTESRFVMILRDSKQDYTGTLAEYARDATARMLKKLTSTEAGSQESAGVQGRSAIQQVVRGETSRLRIAYFINYVEGSAAFYQVICWSLQSNESFVQTGVRKDRRNVPGKRLVNERQKTPGPFTIAPVLIAEFSLKKLLFVIHPVQQEKKHNKSQD